MPAPERRRPPLVAGAGRRRADGPGLLRPARHAAARASVDRPRARRTAQPRRRRVVRCRPRVSRRGNGLSANSMVDDDYTSPFGSSGPRGDALVHNFIKPQDDDRLTISTPDGTASSGWAPGRRTPTNSRRSPRMSQHGTPLPLGHRRRGREHGLRRRGLPRGGHLNASLDRGPFNIR